jgi:ribosomal protein L7Ae-like RNA K-turn-binding protein
VYEGLEGMLGLAFRAGQLVPGLELSVKLIKDNKAGIALLDPDASANTQKKMRDACNHYRIQVILLEAGMLGKACGRPGMAAGAVKPGGFAEQIKRKAEDTNQEQSTQPKQ